MKKRMKSVLPRPLTPHERAVTQWVIEHGHGTAGVKAGYLDQLERAFVIGECECGCASLDFAIDGAPAQGKDREILGDFTTADRAYGLSVFASGGQLDGIEVFEMEAQRPCATLPAPSSLTEIQWK
jgi:hypothetical protein